MKHEKILYALVILNLIISIAALLNSLQAIHRNMQQEELLQAINAFDVHQAAGEEFVFGQDRGLVAENLYPETDEQPAVEQPADSNTAVAPSQPEATKTKAKKPETKKPETVQTIVDEDGYVDLGLPSGARWKAQNEEGLVTFDAARKKYGHHLPSLKHWDELTKYCKWEWAENGYRVIGPNGQSIFMPAAGYRNFSGQIGKVGVFGNYWSSTSKNKEEAWRLGFEPDKISLATNSRKYGRSVRLIKRGSFFKEIRD